MAIPLKQPKEHNIGVSGANLLRSLSEIDLSQLGHATNFIRELNTGGGFAAATQMIVTSGAVINETLNTVTSLNVELNKALGLVKDLISEVDKLGCVEFCIPNLEHIRTSEQREDLPSETASSDEN